MKQIRFLWLVVVLASCSKQLPAPPVSNAGKVVQPIVTMKLKAVELGDMSCYITVIDEKGAEHVWPADFALCPGAPGDVSKLIGLPVRLTWGKANVLSASCAGQVDCGKSDLIDIVKAVLPVSK